MFIQVWLSKHVFIFSHVVIASSLIHSISISNIELVILFRDVCRMLRNWNKSDVMGLSVLAKHVLRNTDQHLRKLTCAAYGTDTGDSKCQGPASGVTSTVMTACYLYMRPNS